MKELKKIMGRRDRQRMKCIKFNCRFRRIQCVIIITMVVIFFIIIFTMRDLYITEQVIENTVHAQSLHNNIDDTSIISNVHERTSTPTVKPTLKPITKPTTLQPTSKLTPNPTNKPTNKEKNIGVLVPPIIRKPANLEYTSTIETWEVNWTLANSIHNLTMDNVSESVIWINNNYNGYCGTQLYPILTNANGLEYLWVHDVMSIEMGRKYGYLQQIQVQYLIVQHNHLFGWQYIIHILFVHLMMVQLLFLKRLNL